MLRNLLLALARSPLMRRMVISFPPAKRVARRFVAGETLPEALEVVRQLTGQGLKVTLDLLGENVDHPDAAKMATQAWLDVLEGLRRAELDSHISLKLTQLGLDQSEEVALQNLTTILRVAKEMNTFVRIDMEGSEYTERTLHVFHRARAGFDNVGVVIQAYLHRTEKDLQELNRIRGRVRLCKGAYSEPPSIAYQSREEVTDNFKKLLREALLHGEYPAVASHDEEVIQEALRIVREHNIPNNKFEFQMLYGIRREKQLELHRMGYTMRIYVPFGSDWYPYFMRRLAERPANLVFFLTALFRG